MKTLDNVMVILVYAAIVITLAAGAIRWLVKVCDRRPGCIVCGTRQRDPLTLNWAVNTRTPGGSWFFIKADWRFCTVHADHPVPAAVESFIASVEHIGAEPAAAPIVVDLHPAGNFTRGAQ